jgi:hypothetical protein
MNKVAYAAALGVLAFAQQAHATTVLNFDTLADGTVLSNEYAGVTFTGASVLSESGSLNPQFPPVSGENVAYDYLDGSITLNFSSAVHSIGGYVTANEPITLSAYNGATLLGTTLLASANSTAFGTPNTFLSLAFPTITSAVFSNGTSLGNSFTLDNVTIGAAVPEPTTWAMLMLGFGAVGAVLRSRRRVAVSYG